MNKKKELSEEEKVKLYKKLGGFIMFLIALGLLCIIVLVVAIVMIFQSLGIV